MTISIKKCIACNINLNQEILFSEIHVNQSNLVKFTKCLRCKSILPSENFLNNNSEYERNINQKELTPQTPFIKHYIEIGAGVDQFIDLFWIISHCLDQRKKNSILEIGCGLGFFIEIFRISLNNNGEFIGIDPNLYTNPYFFGAQIEKKYLDSDFSRKNKNKFNLIAAFDVIEHLDEPISFLNFVYESLNELGMALFSVPTLNESDSISEGERYAILSPGEHKIIYSVSGIKYLLKRSVFKNYIVLKYQNKIYILLFKSLKLKILNFFKISYALLLRRRLANSFKLKFYSKWIQSYQDNPKKLEILINSLWFRLIIQKNFSDTNEFLDFISKTPLKNYIDFKSGSINFSDLKLGVVFISFEDYINQLPSFSGAFVYKIWTILGRPLNIESHVSEIVIRERNIAPYFFVHSSAICKIENW